MTKVLGKQLSEVDIAKRRSRLAAELRQAQKAFEAAALNAATGEGSIEAQREARARVQELEEQLTALGAAEDAAIALRQRQAIEAERSAWVATESEVDRLAADVSAAADELEPLIERVSALSETYREGRKAIGLCLGRHRLRQRTAFDRLRTFNLSAARDLEAAGQAVVALRTLQDNMLSLGSDAGGAMSELRPDSVGENG